MKKVLTAMTAISLTLQANDNLNKTIDKQANSTDLDAQSIVDAQQLAQSELGNINTEVLGASGSILDVNKFVNLNNDVDGSRNVSPGDLLAYEISTFNPSQTNGSGLFFTDIPDANTQIVPGSVVSSSSGIILEGNDPGDESVIIDMGDLAASELDIISYQVTVGDIPDGQTRSLTNQAIIDTDNLSFYLSDDPWVFGGADPDPTVILAIGEPIDAFNEAQNDDFPDHFSELPKVGLRSEVDRITGSVGGLGSDFEDCFSFDVTDIRTVLGISVEDLITSGGNFSTSFQVFTGLPPIKLAIGDIVSTNVDEFSLGRNLLNRNLDVGTYSICLFEETPSQEYSILILSDLQDIIFDNDFEQ